MSTTVVTSTYHSDTLESLIARLDEPEWLIERRRAAWQAFDEMPWPDPRSEEWMRTDIRLFKLDQYPPPGLQRRQTSLPTAVLAEGVDLAGRTASLDGVPQDSRLLDEFAAQGVVFGNLSRMAAEHADLVKRWYAAIVDPRQDRFAALHAALWSSGTFVYIPRGVTVDRPLHIQSAISDGGSDFSHTLVVLEDGAEATVLYENGSFGEHETGLHCGALEVVVGDRASLRLVNLQDWGQGVWHFAHQRATVGRDANLQWTIGALGARVGKVNQHVALTGDGARCQVNGVMFTEGRQQLTYNTLQHHRRPHTTSDFLYKAALQDQSRTVWRGMIKVDPGAIKTDGYQRNDNLLLSTKARADSIPGLEIEADDVRCTHGSTSGRVDEELIFYARARGFTRQEAIQMIVTGFFQQIFDRITIPSVREALGRAIARRVREYE